jgi:hypothetical protein
MIWIFNKKKKIKIDIFTYDEEALQHAPILKAQHYIPEWWKKLPVTSKKYNNIKEAEEVMIFDKIKNANMKRCFGFVELYKRGFILPSWSDFTFDVNKEKIAYTYMRGREPSFHSKDQFEGAFTDFSHIKLVTPWFIREKSGINFIFKGDVWNNHNQKFHIVDGIVRYDVLSSTNINMMFPKLDYPYKTVINFGDPLIHIIPLVPDDVEIEFDMHLRTIEECRNSIDAIALTRAGGPPSVIKFLNKTKKNSGKCPF